MEENLYNRIGEADLNPTYKDGQVYQHTDVNNMLSILKLAINENYYDIQRLWNGERSVGNADELDGATLSRYLNEELQADDNKVPSSQQVMSYINALFEDFSPPIRGVDYWTEEDKLYIIDETANRIIDELKGEYDANTTYEKLNIVFYQGSTYFALRQTKGNLPTNTTYWQLLAKRGDSAYEIYQKHGGTLPEDVWVDEFTNAENFYNKEEVDNKLSLRDLLINQKPYYFNTVAAMKAYDLSAGDYVITKGYHQANDGGCASYEIVNDNSLVDDGGSIITLNNELKAILLIKDVVCVKQFGAYGDNTHNDTSKLQKAIDYTQEKNGVLYLNNGIYKITSPLTITKSFKMIGDYNKGETNTGYLGSEIIQASENTNLINFTTNSIYNMQIENIRFKGNGGRGLNIDGIFFSEFSFNNLIFNGGFADALYLDQATIGDIRNCVISSNNGGINLKNASGIVFTNNNFWNNILYGIKFGTVSNCYFLKNWFENDNTRPYPNFLFQAPTSVARCVFETCGFQNSGKESIKIDYITNITEICRLTNLHFNNCNFQNNYECSILVNNDDGNGNRNSNANSYSADNHFNNCVFNRVLNYCVKTDYSSLNWLFNNCNVYSNYGYGNQSLTNSIANLISSKTENNRGLKVDTQYQFENIKNSSLVSKNSLYLSSNILKWRNNSNSQGDSVALILKGTSSNRPTTPEIGTQYFDTTLNKPIWFNQNSQWIDSAGTIV